MFQNWGVRLLANTDLNLIPRPPFLHGLMYSLAGNVKGVDVYIFFARYVYLLF
jgi:hypothetical protein